MVKICLIKHHAMKKYGGSGRVAALLNVVWSASRLDHFILEERASGTCSTGSCMYLRVGLNAVERGIPVSLFCRESRVNFPVISPSFYRGRHLEAWNVGN
jgi:hypothetical protein